jgi:predicted  nucleic acid-binding Zn-ribbon protein
MENDRLKPKLEVPEIRQEIEEGEKIAQEIQEQIDAHLDDLKFHIENLEFYTGYADHMKSHNEFIEDYKKEMGEPSQLKSHTPQEIEENKRNIQETKRLIAEIHEKMNEAASLKIDFNAQNEVFEKLERIFNDLMTHIPPEQQN